MPQISASKLGPVISIQDEKKVSGRYLACQIYHVEEKMVLTQWWVSTLMIYFLVYTTASAWPTLSNPADIQ